MLFMPLDTVLLVEAFSTALLFGFWILYTNSENCRNISKFTWSSFVRPFSASTDSGWGRTLERFYAGQADAYDASRRGLLKGRMTMMKLATSHLRAGLATHEKGNLVWVDVLISKLSRKLMARLGEEPDGTWRK